METLSTFNIQETKSINGRICYKDLCCRCGQDKGFVRKENLGKKCKSCSAHLNKIGKTSPKKGIKTNKPAWNRGLYFHNDTKKILRNRMSRRLRHALERRNLSKKWQHVFSIVGFTINDLFSHLESKFQPGMSWSNIGEWHIDHIIPESAFNYSSFEDIEFKQCWSLNNLQPLWAKDNLSKSDKIIFGG
jgi:RNase P protein component